MPKTRPSSLICSFFAENKQPDGESSGGRFGVHGPGEIDLMQRRLATQALAIPSTAADVLRFRVRYRQEMNCQIVHDSIHRREGWTLIHLLTLGGTAVGFASIAIAGPWTDKPTIFEFYVVPEHRTRAFDLFEALLARATNARFMEIQSNDSLISVMLHAYARDIWSEKIVFQDAQTTALPPEGAVFRRTTSDEDTRRCIDEQQGGSEGVLELQGATVATGGLMFHYNAPYADIFMEVAEPFRRRGFGSYLVQELKQLAYAVGAIPGARCNPNNVPSRKTLQKAGLVPFAHMLNGTLAGR
jgi:GNAT superfamily N-acetyltransferase